MNEQEGQKVYLSDELICFMATKVSKQTQNNRIQAIEWNKSIMYSNQ